MISSAKHDRPRAWPGLVLVPCLAACLLPIAVAEPPEPSDAPPSRGEPDGPPPPPPRPPREGDFRGGQPPRERGQFRPEGPGGPQRPSPDRFVERAMRYDDDKDGKLDRDELRTFAEDLMERFHPGDGGPPVPPRERFERGEFPEGAKGPERPPRPFEGRRPQRPDNEVLRDGPDGDRPAPPPAEGRRAPEAE